MADMENEDTVAPDAESADAESLDGESPDTAPPDAEPPDTALPDTASSGGEVPQVVSGSGGTDAPAGVASAELTCKVDTGVV